MAKINEFLKNYIPNYYIFFWVTIIIYLYLVNTFVNQISDFLMAIPIIIVLIVAPRILVITTQKNSRLLYTLNFNLYKICSQVIIRSFVLLITIEILILVLNNKLFPQAYIDVTFIFLIEIVYCLIMLIIVSKIAKQLIRGLLKISWSVLFILCCNYILQTEVIATSNYQLLIFLITQVLIVILFAHITKTDLLEGELYD